MADPSRDDPAGELLALLNRQRVRDVLVRFLRAMDTRDWESMRACITTDASFDHGPSMGAPTGADEVITMLRGALSRYDACQHVMLNELITLDQDTATASYYVQAQYVRRDAEGGDILLVGGAYDDRLLYTLAGWRIARRIAQPVTWRAGNTAIRELPLRLGRPTPVVDRG